MFTAILAMQCTHFWLPMIHQW